MLNVNNHCIELVFFYIDFPTFSSFFYFGWGRKKEVEEWVTKML
jgi:hypothetical protein